MHSPSRRRRLVSLSARAPQACVAFVLASLSACGGDAPISNASLCPAKACQPAGVFVPGQGCNYSNLADGTACDDGAQCTTNTTCKAGICVGSNKANGSICTDDNVCTQRDSCQNGNCVGEEPLQCQSDNACLYPNYCDPTSGCQTEISGPCSTNLTTLPVSGCTVADYFAPLVIGGKTFMGLIDSGSSTTAVASSRCTSCPSYLTPRYQTGAGTTGVDQGQATSAIYGDNTGWTGEIYKDTVSGNIAGATVGGPVSMNVVAIDMESNNFFTPNSCVANGNNAYQAIWGLGPQALALADTDAYLTRVALAQLLPFDAFAVQLCGAGGRMWLGGYNPNFTLKPPAFTPMTNTKYYTVTFADVKVGGQSLGVSSGTFGAVVVDTGTGPTVLPAQAYKSFVAQLANTTSFAANFTADFFDSGACVQPVHAMSPNQIDEILPAFSVIMPTSSDAEGLVLTSTATQSYLFAVTDNTGAYYYCPVITEGDDITIMGNNMMRDYVVVFDRGNQRVGFAPQQGCASVSP